VEGLMDDINAIAKTLNTNIKEQGKTLVQVNENVTDAKDNAVEAHKAMEKASDHQKSGNKWLCWVLSVIGGCSVFAIIMLILFSRK
jgi:t-SNARE complex subunit (syntaxin)